MLEVVYLIFNEGYAASGGAEWMRPELCHDALRLGRVLAELAPGEPEAHGLVALMEIQASRLGARSRPTARRFSARSEPRALGLAVVRRGLAALERAVAPGAARPVHPASGDRGVSCPRARGSATDWAGIATLYGELAAVAPSPIVELNRAVAVGMAEGPAAGLAVLDGAALDDALAGYHLLPSVRGDLLAKLGRLDEARAELLRAAGLTANTRERELSPDRASRL